MKPTFQTKKHCIWLLIKKLRVTFTTKLYNNTCRITCYSIYNCYTPMHVNKELLTITISFEASCRWAHGQRAENRLHCSVFSAPFDSKNLQLCSAWSDVVSQELANSVRDCAAAWQSAAADSGNWSAAAVIWKVLCIEWAQGSSIERASAPKRPYVACCSV